ncbi:high affinity cGMP-specific 3',5'-cyclic phosphodiesterase 9A-like isoform X2 [Babylonia areolata]|uniref:high affinity cGMP-specific 3',5'-cyclic phosphodiesterase 9A-like isoform X2 n=1 Tax=Babylonia areolata TaxID=304850 RepID=UPI003FD0FBC2
MATKVVYFVIDGREEQAEFHSDDESEDVRELFRAAAEAGPYDILKLYNPQGNIINISERLVPNSPDTRYNLEVVATNYSSLLTGKDDVLANKIVADLETIEQRLETLEKKVYVDNGCTPQVFTDLKTKAEQLREKLEGLEHLSWLGLFKNMSMGTSQPFWDKRTSSQKMDTYRERVMEKFMAMSKVQLTWEVREQLKKPTFDNWQWDDSEMLILLRQMFLDLGLVAKFNIQMPVLLKWLFKIYTKYNHVPFHNFKHCFMVSQMMYGLIWLIDLPSKLEPIDILTLLTASICHDLDHPGYNNAYQINARTELALRYNDISPLENHHCAVAFEVLEKEDCNIFQHLPKDQFRKLREGMIRCILATDMAKHNEIVNSFKSIIPHFDFSDKEHRAVLQMVLMKTADISNEARPLEVATPWLDCLLTEFFNQSDMEKLEGLPVAPFMDRDKVTKPSSQIGFIKFVLLPLFESVGQLFPQIDADVIEPVRKALAYYTEMQQAIEDGKKKEKETGSKQNGITT